jgi:peptide-methionine (S)-S-oxide reductase
LGKSGTFAGPIVTEVKPLDVFYEAEDYHRSYYDRNSQQPYCQIVIDPKVSKLRSQFQQLLLTS